MTKGGAREGSGRKPKYLDYGQEGEAEPVKLPKQISQSEYDAWVKETLMKKQNLDKKD